MRMTHYKCYRGVVLPLKILKTCIVEFLIVMPTHIFPHKKLCVWSCRGSESPCEWLVEATVILCLEKWKYYVWEWVSVPSVQVIVMIIIIIIAFKRAIRDFFTVSSLRHEPSPTHMLKWPGRSRVQITRNTSSAYHVQHVVLHVTWHELTAQLLSLTEFKSHIIF